jgi:hypothetical protein
MNEFQILSPVRLPISPPGGRKVLENNVSVQGCRIGEKGSVAESFFTFRFQRMRQAVVNARAARLLALVSMMDSMINFPLPFSDGDCDCFPVRVHADTMWPSGLGRAGDEAGPASRI